MDIKAKYAADGSMENYKTRFMARGLSQKEGVEYDKTFAPIPRYGPIKAVIYIASEKGWRIHLMDVKTTLLNGVVEKEVYIEPTQRFEMHGRKSHVCMLKKAYFDHMLSSIYIIMLCVWKHE